MTRVRCIAPALAVLVVLAVAVGASGAPVAFLASGDVTRLEPPEHLDPGSVLVTALGDRQWLLRPSLGEVVVFVKGRPAETIALPESARQSADGGIWSLSAVDAGAGRPPVVWLVRGDRGLAWRLDESTRWSGPFRLGEPTGAAVALAPDLLVYSTPTSGSAAFALFDAAKQATARRFGRRREPAHPLLDREENLWLLTKVHGTDGERLVTASVFSPEIRSYSLPHLAPIETPALPQEAVEHLIRARRRAMDAVRNQRDCSSCIEARLVVFADALGSEGDGVWLHLEGQQQLIRIGGTGTKTVPLDVPAEEAAAVRGLALEHRTLLLVSETILRRLQPTDSLPIHLGSVVDSDRMPVAGARVVWAGADGRSFTAVTGPDGGFMLQGIRVAPTGRLEITAEGFRPFRRIGRLAELVAEPVMLERLPRICIRTVNGSGEPVRRYTATILHPESGPGSAGFETGPARDVDDVSGRVCLASPWTLPVVVEVNAQGYVLTRKRIASIETGEEIEVELAPEARLRVEVTDEKGSRPVPEAEVTLFEPGAMDRAVREAVPSGHCTTGSDGRCVMSQLPAGTFTAVVRREGYLDAQDTVTLEATGADGEASALHIELRKGARIRVSVTAGGSDQPVQGAQVGLSGVGRALDHAASCTTDASGGCLLDGIRPGLYRITATEPSLGRRSKKVAVREEDREIDVALDLSGELRVEGVVEGIDLYPGVTFEVLAVQPGFQRRTDLDSSGRFVMEGVPARTTWFYVTDQRTGSSYGFTEEELRPGEEIAEVRIVLDPPLSVWGRVTLGGAACVACAVRASSDGAGALAVLVDAKTGVDGEYELKLPTAGAYRISARDPLSGARADRMLDVRSNTPLDIEIAGGTVRGHVLGASDGNGIPGAAVRATDDSGSVLDATTSGEDGSFILRSLPRRTIRLLAVHGSASTDRTVDLTGSAEAEVDLVLEEQPGIRLIVTDPSGQTVSLVHAWIGGPAGQSITVPGLVADRDGVVDLPAFSTNPHTVVLHPPGLARLTLWGVDPGQGPFPVTVPLAANLSLEVRGDDPACQVELLDATGRPMALDLGPPGSRPIQSGGALFNALPPGRVTVVITTCGGRTVTADAVLTAGAITVVPITTGPQD